MTGELRGPNDLQATITCQSFAIFEVNPHFDIAPPGVPNVW